MGTVIAEEQVSSYFIVVVASYFAGSVQAVGQTY